jgi:hypothetical protein
LASDKASEAAKSGWNHATQLHTMYVETRPPIQLEEAMVYLAELKLPKMESPEFSRFPITSLTIVLVLLLFIGESIIVLLLASVSYSCT